MLVQCLLLCALGPAVMASGDTRCVLNDNFCDCGHDEPGTAACSFFSPQKFQCGSADIFNQTIPSSRVDDGVCDCCDGSDEALYCRNTCKDLAQARQAELERLEQLKSMGLQAAEKIVASSKVQLESIMREAEANKALIEETENQIQHLREELTAANSRADEASSSVAGAIATLKQKRTTDLMESLSGNQARDVLAQAALSWDRNTIELIILGMSNAHLASKSGTSVSELKAVELYEMHSSLRDLGSVGDDSTDVSVGSDGNSEDVTRARVAIMRNFLTLDFANDDDIYPLLNTVLEKYPQGCRSGNVIGANLNKELQTVCDLLRKNSEEMDLLNAPSNEAQQEAKRIKKLLSDSEASLNAQKKSVQDANDIAGKNFGPDNVLFSLWKQCYKSRQDKYTYTVCPYDNAKQDQTSLGKFKSVDFGPNGVVFSFNFGDRCFSSKFRELKLALRCSERTEITSVAEPETCSYVATLETPIACVIEARNSM
jgi:protein kinase C substrate 80K-H